MVQRQNQMGNDCFWRICKFKVVDNCTVTLLKVSKFQCGICMTKESDKK